MQVDAAWPNERLVVELDGWAYHHDRGAFQEDR
jgi:very-short-patch-repair endonuclease